MIVTHFYLKFLSVFFQTCPCKFEITQHVSKKLPIKNSYTCNTSMARQLPWNQGCAKTVFLKFRIKSTLISKRHSKNLKAFANTELSQLNADWLKNYRIYLWIYSTKSIIPQMTMKNNLSCLRKNKQKMKLNKWRGDIQVNTL